MLAIDGSVVRCAHASVRAEEIVVATNASAAMRWPAARRVAVFRSAIVLTEPVPDLHGRIGWAGREAIADARTYLSFFPAHDNRVLMGSASGDYRRAENTLRRYFRSSATSRSRRGGRVQSTFERPASVIGTVPGSRVHYAAGFTGNGVGPSWLVGKTLASLALGQSVRSPLLAARAPSLPPEPLRSVGASVVRRALLAIDDAETAGRRPPRWAGAIRRVPELVGLRVASR